MTPEDLAVISKVFKDADPDSIMKRLNELERSDRMELAENLFEIVRRVYGTVLEPSIRDTFQNIHKNMKRMFFKQIFHVNQNLRTERQIWAPKIKQLREIKLFAETSDFDLLNIAENLEEVELKANTAFLSQYEEVTGVYLLKHSANVFEFNSKMPVITRSGIFGDDACATGERESAVTVKAVSDCTALFIPRDKFSVLSRSVPGLQEKVFQSVVERAKQGSIRAEEQRKLTQEILDNIGQGSFSIDVAGEIGENYTAIAADYLGTDNLAGVPFADLAFRNDRSVLRNYYRALHLLFSGTEFNHDVILDLLPDEVNINKRDFKLHYSFVQDGAGNVMSVFVRMEDITLQREIARKEQLLNAVTAKMQSNVGGFMDMLDDVQKSYNKISEFADQFWAVNNQPDEDLINEIMRMLHGSKGLSGQFELVKLKDVVHRCEDWFIAIEKDGMETHYDKFAELYADFEHELEYARSFKENLGEGIIQILEGISFKKDEFSVLEEAAKKGDFEAIQSIILNKNNVPAEKIINNWKADAERLGKRLRKAIDIDISIEDDLAVPKELAKDLNVNLAHVYRNCVDHGIEDAKGRMEAGKEELGKIAISIKKDNNDLVMEIVDDGAGIDYPKISQLAIENASLDQNLVQKYIEDEEYWRILFLAGFSSAEEVTDLSGRGVGMNAVLTTVESYGGTVAIESELSKGTKTLLTVPLHT